MFIELTDHLRCPAAHDEAFLVLVPDVVVDRSVRRGRLGCPVCGVEYPIVEGVPQFGAAAFAATTDAEADAQALQALLGLEGPGGWVALVGGAASAALTDGLDGIGLVLVDPPTGIAERMPRVSLVSAAMLPFKSRALRGVVLGREIAAEPHWLAEAKRAVLPGRHVVGHGPEPPVAAGLSLLASAGGWWVAV